MLPISPLLGRGKAGVEHHRIELLVLQPTPFCNINCRYCYLPNRHVAKRISSSTLRRTMQRVFCSDRLGDRLTIVWHAGEPLVLPVSFYEDAFDLIASLSPPGLQIQHSFQTNGLLLDDAWTDFIQQTGSKLGLSLDGPRHLHDAYRVTRRGAGTFDAAMRAVGLLRDRKLDFHVITVLTRAALDAADDLFDFYISNDIRRVGFNVEEIEGDNTTSSLQAEDSCEAYTRFLKRFLELQRSTGERIEVREFQGAEAAILYGTSRAIENPQAGPFRIVSIDVDGNISTFSPELLGYSNPRFGAFVFGNVHTEPLEKVWANRSFQMIHAEITAGVRACRDSCDYFGVCGGGAPANKLFETGRFDSTETLYCRLNKKAVVDVVLADLESRLGLA